MRMPRPPGCRHIVMQPVLGTLDVPAAIDFVLADRGIKDAVVSEFRRTRS